MLIVTYCELKPIQKLLLMLLQLVLFGFQLYDFIYG